MTKHRMQLMMTERRTWMMIEMCEKNLMLMLSCEKTKPSAKNMTRKWLIMFMLRKWLMLMIAMNNLKTELATRQVFSPGDEWGLSPPIFPAWWQ